MRSDCVRAISLVTNLLYPDSLCYFEWLWWWDFKSYEYADGDTLTMKAHYYLLADLLESRQTFTLKSLLRSYELSWSDCDCFKLIVLRNSWHMCWRSNHRNAWYESNHLMFDQRTATAKYRMPGSVLFIGWQKRLWPRLKLRSVGWESLS